MIIFRLLNKPFNLFYFSTEATKKVGRTVVANLPRVQYPTKPKPEHEDERFSMNLLYETSNYLRKDKMPNCRYFAVQYNNRIYRFYNAYYYPLGRMIDRVATEIRGKTSPHYKNGVLNVKNGDVCVIVNIEDPLITGKKLLFKKLRYHTGFIGHLKEYSYKYILNHKPELLYHHLLKKTMPKNKLSMKYLDNLILCRGPTHNLAHFPEFAPDKKIYSLLPEINLLEMVQKDPSIKVVEQSEPGASEKMLGRTPERYYTERQLEQMRREQDENIENLNRVHEDVPKFKKVPKITQKQFETLKRREKMIEDRYKQVRAPNKKKNQYENENIKFFTSEKKARKDPLYPLMANEELEEIDEENTAEFPLVKGGADQKPK